MKISNIWKAVYNFLGGFHTAMLYKSTAQLEYEIREIENSFSLMLFGNLVGLPGPSMALTLELMPDMTDKLERMLLRAGQTGNGLSELASIMGEP